MRGQRHTPAALFPRKDPVPILHKTGWAPGPVWRGAENLVPTGIRSRTVQPVAQSLYRLSYRAHYLQCTLYEFLCPFCTECTYRMQCARGRFRPLNSTSPSTVRNWTQCLIVIVSGKNPHTEGHDKWFNMEEEIACGKMLRCTNKDQIRILSRY